MEKTESSFIVQVIKGVVLSVICSLIGILIFALILKVATLSNLAVKSVNQFIKAISIFIGCFFSLKGSKGLIKGLLIGVFWAVIVYLIFLLLGSGESLTSVGVDVLFGGLVGVISGIATVNMKK